MRRLLLLGLLAASCDRCHGPPAPPPKPPVTLSHARPAVRPTLMWKTAASANTPEAWDAAADVYEREAKGCTTDCIDAKFAIVLARRNALSAAALTPLPGDDKPELPERVRALVDAIDDYVAIAPPDDPSVVENKFVAASTMYRWHQDDAVDRLEEMLRIHRYDELAEYCANMLLDELIRRNDVDQMKYWVFELLADARFMAGKDQLRQTLEMLRERLE
jgi:hypothetical protein